MIKIANAPVSWGVDYPDTPGNPEWSLVLDQIADAGYQHCEIGPFGYSPTDPDILRREYARRKLTPIGGFIFQPLHDPAAEKPVIANVRDTVLLLGALGAGYLVVIDHISEKRMATAGNPAKTVRLPEASYAHMIRTIRNIAEIAAENGVTAVIHQHAGTYIEFEDEVERVLCDIPASEAAICVDTGHMIYAGIDPVAFYRRHAERVRHFHFKDIDPAVLRMVVDEGIGFLDAVGQNVFCPLGRGAVDWPGLRKAVEEHGYDQHATVEQDVDPAMDVNPLRDARTSLEFLHGIGF